MKTELLLGSLFKTKENVPCCTLPDDVTFANGIYFQDTASVDFSGSGTLADPITAVSPSLIFARNGASVDSLGFAVLGQSVGEVGNPAQLLNNREIHTGTFSMVLQRLAGDDANYSPTTFDRFGITIAETPLKTSLNQLQVPLNIRRKPRANPTLTVPQKDGYVPLVALFNGGILGNSPHTVQGGTNANRAATIIASEFQCDASGTQTLNGWWGILKTSFQFTSNATASTTEHFADIIVGSSEATTANKTVTNRYGLYIVPKATRVTTQYAIFQEGTGTAEFNIFGARSSFGKTTVPTAKIHAAAQTATAGTAPLKLDSSVTLMTTPENGAFEFDGTNLYFTVGGVRKTFTLV